VVTRALAHHRVSRERSLRHQVLVSDFWHTRGVRSLSSALPCFATFCLSLTACPQPEPEPMVMETETGEPSCLDTQTPGPDVILNADVDVAELQLSDCVPGAIIISGPGITNLSALETLREVGRLEVRYCPYLQGLTGLHNLVRVDTLVFSGNGALPNLLDFNDLEQVDSLVITDNVGLTDLGSFPISSLSHLEITGNPDLTDLSGLESLTSVSGSVTVSVNPQIENFTGIDALTNVGGDLTIEDNDGLTSLDGLSVTTVGGDLKILSNAALSECLAMDFIATCTVGGATLESDNMSDLCG
jgi:hypothetical protein